MVNSPWLFYFIVSQKDSFFFVSSIQFLRRETPMNAWGDSHRCCILEHLWLVSLLFLCSKFASCSSRCVTGRGTGLFLEPVCHFQSFRSSIYPPTRCAEYVVTGSFLKTRVWLLFHPQITQEEALLAVAAFPAIRELDICSNPLTARRTSTSSSSCSSFSSSLHLWVL